MKKLISVVLCMVLLSALFLLSGAEPETAASVPSEWATASVEQAEQLGILPAGFAPDWQAPITREDFCDLAFHTMKAAGKAAPVPATPPFTDTANQAAAALHELGIITGKDEGLFAPADLLTREEAATILWRMSEQLGCVARDTDLILYMDHDQIASWAQSPVYVMFTLGVMQGTGTGFSPKDNYTTEQAVATLIRLYNVRPEVAAMTETACFADELYAKMPANQNYMFSPLSIKMALAMAANGAAGETRQEILTVLGIADLADYNEEAKKLIETFSATEMVRLELANSLWINQSETNLSFSQDFKTLVEQYYYGKAHEVNNSNSMQTVNDWVREKTAGKITKILDKPEFEALLINALYFKGAWQSEFSPEATEPAIFTDGDGVETEIDFMNKTFHIPYYEKDGIRIAALPYKNRQNSYSEEGELLDAETLEADVSMYVILSEGESYHPQAVLEAALAEGFSSERVRFSMPKFKIEFETGLNEMLQEMGIDKAFENDVVAEFQPMLEQGNMYLVNALHKTFIEVDEKGTEAAAVTGIFADTTSMPAEPIDFRADRPFTFVIRDNTSGEILFMGKYAYAE